ncbi:hypothetical protein DdX_19110 [Ditylenchus destructor]|uniref:Uncharacterized protein n=1 Tax=Ditylenchus destructor TaxID=166010 RepID=A0AAD4MIC1_9BILA|nr:hypothetical protein DdX_19110 [Ditylenchus destructor]
MKSDFWIKCQTGLCIQKCYNADVNCLLTCNVDPACQAACANRYNECVAGCPTREPDRCCNQCPDDPTCVEERCCKYNCHCR